MIDDIENQSLVVKNIGSEPFRGRYQNQLTLIEAGHSAIVRREAAVLWFGDPRLIDQVRNGREVFERSAEVERIKLRYGINELEGRAKTWDDLPQVEITNHAGEVFRFVIHDPVGETVTPAEQTVAENRLLQEQMEAMKAELANLQARMQHAPTETPVDDVPDDGPQAKRGRAS